MSEGRSWKGNWRVRLYERVRERGYDSLTAFAEAHPTASLVALADELGPEDIAAVQVFSGLVAEAERSRKVTRLVRGQLVRTLSQRLPNGWPAPLDDANRLKVAVALGSSKFPRFLVNANGRIKTIAYLQKAFCLSLGDAAAAGAWHVFPDGTWSDEEFEQFLLPRIRATRNQWMSTHS